MFRNSDGWAGAVFLRPILMGNTVELVAYDEAVKDGA